ncbi:uncharacterized protein B0H18DRAFT_1117659 [Fomitopsis serialis]|uniref:uncharacterized protein n=1 Tax=Fomitopsis serialis TaxID=139415 RepID=UPI0020082D5D|nr:uncharacterized protein B0H18DRAFT_1117659 [Neoantrodia serialis]KAH9928828.1 hypothetical protein B0H18DRAFT_1117659 [Neoantrodia serialis]
MSPIHIHSASLDPAVHPGYCIPRKTLAQRLGLKGKKGAKRRASAPVPAPAPRTMGDLKLECALVSLDVAKERQREVPCGAFDIGCTLISLDVARGAKEISHRALR